MSPGSALAMSPITSPYCTSQNKEEIKREKATWATWETEQKFHTILLILHRNYVLSFDTANTDMAKTRDEHSMSQLSR